MNADSRSSGHSSGHVELHAFIFIFGILTNRGGLTR